MGMMPMSQSQMESAAKSGIRIGHRWWQSIFAEPVLLYLNLCDFIRPFL
jgi:hypothetical protein